MKEIQDSLNDTLVKSDLTGVSIDLAEIVMDSFIDEGILKDVPIIGTIVGIGKTAYKISEHLLLRKILSFLEGIKDVPLQTRREMIDLIDKDDSYKLKVGEKLIYTLDKCEDHINAKYIAQLFVAFLKGDITYKQYLQASQAIQDIFIPDLEFFLGDQSKNLEREQKPGEPLDEVEYSLINSGLLYLYYGPIQVEDNTMDLEALGMYRVIGGEPILITTELGVIVYNNLSIE